MDNTIPKACANSLRTFSKEKYNVKLKAAHAHELVAAYMGYKSKNGLIADEKYPITNLSHCEIIVMMPDDFIDERRRSLQGLSTELPDSCTLGEVVYGSMFSDELSTSPLPRFRDFQELAKFLLENDDAYRTVFRFYRDIPVEHVLDIASEENAVTLSVVHVTPTDTENMIGHGETTIVLPRIAGSIGYGKPSIRVVQWSGGARKTLVRRSA